MNKLKAFSLIALFCSMSIGFATKTLAQQPKTKFTNEERIEKLKTDLGLDKKQVVKLTAIYNDQKKELAEIRSSGLDQPGQVLKRRELWQKTDDKIEAILTPEQKSKWPQEKSELKAMESHRPITKPAN